MDRLRRLRRLGYKDYGAYLRSPCWAATKARYRASSRPQACMCGEDQVQLHHMTYVRIGAERLTDLVALCAPCHTMIHILEKRGEITLDFAGFESAHRAALYAIEHGPRRYEAGMDRAPITRNATWRDLRAAIEQDVADVAARCGQGAASDIAAIGRRLDAIERKLLAKLAAQPS